MANKMKRPSRGRGPRVAAPTLFALLSLCLPGAASAQWTQPDARGNISNTDTGNVGVGTTQPGERLDVRGNLILDAGTSPTLFTGTGAGS